MQEECVNCDAVIEDTDFFWRLTDGTYICCDCMQELQVGPYYRRRLSEVLDGDLGMFIVTPYDLSCLQRGL